MSFLEVLRLKELQDPVLDKILCRAGSELTFRGTEMIHSKCETGPFMGLRTFWFEHIAVKAFMREAGGGRTGLSCVDEYATGGRIPPSMTIRS